MNDSDKRRLKTMDGLKDASLEVCPNCKGKGVVKK